VALNAELEKVPHGVTGMVSFTVPLMEHDNVWTMESNHPDFPETFLRLKALTMLAKNDVHVFIFSTSLLLIISISYFYEFE
jgi:hypothetical protein